MMVIKLAPEGFSYRTLADLTEADLLEEKKCQQHILPDIYGLIVLFTVRTVDQEENISLRA